MRLTKKYKNVYGFNEDSSPLIHLQLVADKLGRLEDIEEWLECDITKIIEALHNGYVYVVQEDGKVHLRDLEGGLRKIGFTWCIYLQGKVNDVGVFVITTNAYGLKQTGGWALTREELE